MTREEKRKIAKEAIGDRTNWIYEEAAIVLGTLFANRIEDKDAYDKIIDSMGSIIKHARWIEKWNELDEWTEML